MSSQQFSTLPIAVDPDDPEHAGRAAHPPYAGLQVAPGDGKEATTAHQVLPPAYGKTGYNDPLQAAIATERPWYKKKRFIIGIIAVILIVIAGVVGGVVGSRTSTSSEATSGSSNSISTTTSMSTSTSISTSTSTSTSTSSSSTTSPSAAPTSIASNSRLTAAAWQVGDDDYEIFLAYQDPEGGLRYSSTSGSDPADATRWSDPQSASQQYSVDDGSSMGMGVLPQFVNGPGTPHDIQLEWFFINSSSRINGINFNTGDTASGFLPDSINQERFTALGNSNLAVYWPYILFQAIDNSLRLIKFGDGWEEYNTGLTASPRSTLALVPISRDYTNVRDDGWWGVLYQDNDGRLVPSVNPTGESTGSLGTLSDAWTSSFPEVILPDGASFAAFSVGTPDDDEVDRVDAFVLYQDESFDIHQIWFDNANARWRESSPESLEGADENTSIACITTPSWQDNEALGELLLQPASGLNRCYFHKDGRVVEVRLDGQDWTEPVEIEIP